MLAICACVQILLFDILLLFPLALGIGLQSLIAALTGDIFTVSLLYTVKLTKPFMNLKQQVDKFLKRTVDTWNYQVLVSRYKYTHVHTYKISTSSYLIIL